MASPLQSVINSGTKLWLDSIDPDLVLKNRDLGATGATSNPIIVSDLIKTGRFDAELARLMKQGLNDHDVAWQVTDTLVRQAQKVFEPVWKATKGNDGYVSFELDPLLEDPAQKIPVEERTKQYIALGKQWSAGHTNRMIKTPATAAGIAALEELVAAGVTLNVTLTFSPRQYKAASEAVWRGAQRRGDLSKFKSVYSIFVSRVDQYTKTHVPGLSKQAQGQVGIVNAKRIWQMSQRFWSDKKLPLKQEIIFASTGKKFADDADWKYVQALAGSDIQTNPPATNDAVDKCGLTFTRQVDQMPSAEVLAEIERLVDVKHMEETLMAEGVAKFAEPQYKLLALIAQKRKTLG